MDDNDRLPCICLGAIDIFIDINYRVFAGYFSLFVVLMFIWCESVAKFVNLWLYCVSSNEICFNLNLVN